MFWHGVLTASTIIFALLTALAFFWLFAEPSTETALIFIVVLAITIGSFIGADQIEKANITTHIEVVEMEITKCDMSSRYSTNMDEITSYYFTIGNEYVIKVSSDQYAKYNVGDTILVEVETKTIFGEATETARLK